MALLPDAPASKLFRSPVLSSRCIAEAAAVQKAPDSTAAMHLTDFKRDRGEVTLLFYFFKYPVVLN